MDEEIDEFDEVIKNLRMGDGVDDTTDEKTEQQEPATSQPQTGTDEKVGQLQQILTECDHETLSSVIAELCQVSGLTTDITRDETFEATVIHARRILPHPQSVRIVNHTASQIDGKSVEKLLRGDTESGSAKQTIVTAEPPTENAIETIQQSSLEVINLDDLAKDVLARNLTDPVIKHITADEEIATDDDILQAPAGSTTQAGDTEPHDSDPHGETTDTSDGTTTPVGAEGDYLSIDVVGFDQKRIEYQDRDEDILEERKYTVICLHIENKTSYEWHISSSRDLGVTSTEGFSYDNPQDNGWSSRTGQFTPWNNAKRHDIKPNSKIRAVVIYKTWFEPDRIEYSADLLHVHGDDSLTDGIERISIQLDDAARKGLGSLPDSLPIDGVVLN